MRSAIKPGIYVGIINIILALLIYILDPALFVKWWYGIILLILNLGLVIYFGIQYRNEVGGFLSFNNAFLHGLTTFIVAGIIGTIFNLLLFTVVDPELPELLTEATIEQTAGMMKSFGAPDQSIDETIDQLKEDIPARFSAVGTLKGFGWSLIGYLVLSLISGAIVKKKQPEFA